MTQQPPSRSRQDLQFQEDPYINELSREAGTYLIEDPDALLYIEWSPSDLYFVEESQNISAWGNDYLEINGDFRISYVIPELIPGNYEVYLRADAFDNDNAFVEVFIDGKKIGGLIDLSTGGSASSPFQRIELGEIDISRYSEHEVEIRPLIPGRFLWDYIRFEPVK